jgi:hypothetical protein
MTIDNQERLQSPLARWPFWLITILFCLLLSFALTWISSGFTGVTGWASFLGAVLIAAGIIVGCWWLLGEENLPRLLGVLIITAALLRLAVGAFWFVALPVMGHGSSHERAGYVMSDASKRDLAAYQLAGSNKPLWSAFRDNRKYDQYGGMLFLSSWFYRYLGTDQHNPILIIVITAAVSSLVVLFTWVFTRRAWGQTEAWIAALIMTLYPEAVLLGSSQMREAFTMTLTMVAFYGLILYFQERLWPGLTWVLAALLLCLPLSPPYTALLLLMLALAAIPLNKASLKDHTLPKQLFWLIIGVTVIITAGMWLALKQFAPDDMANPIAVLEYWIRKSAGFQAHITRLDSGWMQQVFRSTPEWTHLPLLLTYGVLQPFLPAAIIAGSHAKIWQWIAIWRAIGWTFFLPFLIYALLRTPRKKDDHGFTLIISLIVWGGILIAAFRGGGDMWDNPRYRAAFAGLGAALTAWGIVEHRHTHDPWLRRAFISVLLILAWFIPWYLGRYTGFYWPVEGLFKTLGLGFVTAAMYLVWDWIRSNSPIIDQKG